MNKTIRAHFYVILATMIVSGSFVVSKKLSGVINPISLTALRLFIATLTLLPIVFINKSYRKKIPSTLFRASIISFFYSMFFVAMFKALETTTTLNTGTLYTLLPLITAVLCLLFLKDKVTLKQIFIYALGIIGTCIVVFKGNLELFLKFSLNSGDWLFLLGTFSMGLYSVFIKLLHRKDDKILVLVFCTLLSGFVWMFLFLNFFNIPFSWERLNNINLISNILYLAIPSTLFTVYLYQQAGIDIGPKKVMAYSYMNPAFIAFLMFVLYSVKISFVVIIGILLSALVTLWLIFS